MLPNVKTNDAFGVIKFGDCSNIINGIDKIQILSTLETLLGCGGWCPLSNGKESNYNLNFYYYRFRDINDCTDFGTYFCS